MVYIHENDAIPRCICSLNYKNGFVERLAKLFGHSGKHTHVPGWSKETIINIVAQLVRTWISKYIQFYSFSPSCNTMKNNLINWRALCSIPEVVLSSGSS